MNRQIITRQAEVCAKCGAVNLFRKTCGTRKRGNIWLAWARCTSCGHRAQIRVYVQNMDKWQETGLT